MNYFSKFFVLLIVLSLASASFGQINWTKDTHNPIFADSVLNWNTGGAFAPCVLFDDTLYRMWYMGYDGISIRIGYATSTDGLNWSPYENNPVLDLGSPGSWDETWVLYPYVLSNDSIFQMWYSGIQGEIGTAGYRERIGYATSLDGISWTKSKDNPVLDVGVSGQWDDHGIDVGSVLFDGENYHLWYGGYRNDFTVRTGSATSPDGIHWSRYEKNPVLNTGDWDYKRIHQARVIFDGNIYHMFYGGGDYFLWRIGYAVSTDGLKWTKFENNPILNIGSGESWESRFVAVPSVMLQDSLFRMWYVGGRMELQGEIGYATAPVEEAPVANFEYEMAEDTCKFSDMSSGWILNWLWDFGDSSSSTEQNPVHIYESGQYTLKLTVTGPFGSDDSTLQITVTDLEEQESNTPDAYSLSQNYPNPFNPKTVIRYTVGAQDLVPLQHIDLSIYNILGQKVATLVNKKQPTGNYSVEWDASGFASGVYLYHLQAGDHVQTKKMIFMK